MSVKHWSTHRTDTACGVTQEECYTPSEVTCRPCLENKAERYSQARHRLAELDRARAQPTVMMGTNDVTQRTVDIAFLARLSDFIASVPGNALDRKSNFLAQQLRREIADVVCPADKVRK